MLTNDPGWRSWRGMGGICLPILLLLASMTASLALTLQPPATGPIAAIFPPWWGSSQSFRAAASAGAVVRFGALPFIVVIQQETDDTRRQLRQAGAWFSVDPVALGACDATGRV
jgi:hypothetical protein